MGSLKKGAHSLKVEMIFVQGRVAVLLTYASDCGLDETSQVAGVLASDLSGSNFLSLEVPRSARTQSVPVRTDLREGRTPTSPC
jgi:hypothetical protein